MYLLCFQQFISEWQQKNITKKVISFELLVMSFLSEEQKIEIDYRLERIEKGEAQMFSWEEVEAEINQKLQQTSKPINE